MQCDLERLNHRGLNLAPRTLDSVVLDARSSSTQSCSLDPRFNGLDEDMLCSTTFILPAV